MTSVLIFDLWSLQTYSAEFYIHMACNVQTKFSIVSWEFGCHSFLYFLM
jgi:hypothetical protein